MECSEETTQKITKDATGTGKKMIMKLIPHEYWTFQIFGLIMDYKSLTWNINGTKAPQKRRNIIENLKTRDNFLTSD